MADKVKDLLSFPFDSRQGDRIYKSKDFSNYFKSLFTNGLGLGDDEKIGMKVSKKGRNITVSKGTIFINGRYALNEGLVELQPHLPHGVLPRVDAVVARLDLGLNARGINLYIKQGIAGTGNPPALTRNPSVWELSLGELNYTGTEFKDITDVREDPKKCGICLAPLVMFYTKEW